MVFEPGKKMIKQKRKRHNTTSPTMQDFIDAFFDRMLAPAPVVVSPIPDLLFRKLICLCHPDKHLGAFNGMATEVTQWLTEERLKSKASHGRK